MYLCLLIYIMCGAVFICLGPLLTFTYVHDKMELQASGEMEAGLTRYTDK